MTAPITPKLSARFRLQWEPVQNAHVLLYPEGMIKLNQSASEILRRCDGSRSVSQLVDELEGAFNQSALSQDIHDFLAMASANGWITLNI